MKKIITLFILYLLCLASYSQNTYLAFHFGGDFLIHDFTNTNVSSEIQLGYFYNENNAVEVDYKHGFEKNEMCYNRIGVNYVCEYNTTEYVAPYFKFGIGYKNYHIDNYDSFDGCDFKLEFGIHNYLCDNVSLNLGFDFSITAIDGMEFSWNNAILNPKIGLSYNF